MTNPLVPNDIDLHDLLSTAQTIAVVGHSDNPGRTSYQIAGYLRAVGYTIYPVNPTVSVIDGQPSYPSLAAVAAPIDIVNVFRRSEFVDGIVTEAIAVGAKAIWTQLGVIDEAALQRAQDTGLHVVMNRCIKVEHVRLGV
ncbi:MAG: CoA-binding protein [Anaerolineaceae bacterium]|nr:CoA-binding protein [Anaerolineaceae bacterium]